MSVVSTLVGGKGMGAMVHIAERLASDAKDRTTEHLAQQLVCAFHDFVRCGPLCTSIGDVSVRIPDTDNILITPFMPYVQGLTASDLFEVTMDGRILGRRGRPSFSQQMHFAIYKARPDVNAVVYSKAPMATVLGLCELPIPPVTVDAVAFSSLPRIPASIHPDAQWAQEVSTQMAGGAPGALLLNLGIVAVGVDLQQAMRRTLALEDTARILVTCYLLQQVPTTLPPAAVEILREVPL